MDIYNQSSKPNDGFDKERSFVYLTNNLNCYISVALTKRSLIAIEADRLEQTIIRL